MRSSLSLLTALVPLLVGNVVHAQEQAETQQRATSAASDVAVEQGVVGNVFEVGETIRLPVRVAGDVSKVAWRIDDAWGQSRARAELSLQDRQGMLEVPTLPPGWYRLSVDAGAGRPAATSNLVVVEPFDLAKPRRSTFGVNTHFEQNWPTDLLVPLSRAGVRHYRDGQGWSAVEKQLGQFDFPANFRSYMSQLQECHAEPLIVLAFGNALHYDVPGVPVWAAAPYTDAQHAAYAAYCQAVLKQYGPQIRNVEIWNEYNGGFARGPADGRPEVYAAMLKAASTAIKSQRPDVQVFGCSTIGVPLQWIEAVFKAGGLAHMDGVSIHPYGYDYAPETLVPALERLRELIRQYNGGRDKPIWITEQGYYTIARGTRGERNPLTEHAKARNLVRAWALFAAHGVDRSYWYLARNDSHFGTMGLVGKPDDPEGRYAPQVSLAAAAALVRQLDDAEFVAQDATPADVYGIHFRSAAGTPVRVMWAPQAVDVAIASPVSLRVVDIVGGALDVHPIDGKVHLRLSETPLYVHGDVGEIAIVKPDWTPVIPAKVAQGERIRAARAEGEWQVPADAAEVVLPLAERRGGNVVYAGFAKVLVVPPLSAETTIRVVDASRAQVRLKNASSTRSFRITTLRWSLDAAQHGEQAIDLTLAPGETKLVDVKLPAMESMRTYEAKIELAVEGGSPIIVAGSIGHHPIPRRKIAIDGDLSDWEGVAVMGLDNAPYKKLLAERKDAADLGGSARVAFDDDHFYFAAAISDEAFDQTHTGYNQWKGDNIQIGISATPPWEGGEWAFRPHEINVALTPNGPEVYRVSGPQGSGVISSATLRVKHEKGVTTYELAIPWRDLDGAKPEGLSFGIYVNDADTAGREGYVQWAEIKRVDRMQRMVLK